MDRPTYKQNYRVVQELWSEELCFSVDQTSINTHFNTRKLTILTFCRDSGVIANVTGLTSMAGDTLGLLSIINSTTFCRSLFSIDRFTSHLTEYWIMIRKIKLDTCTKVLQPFCIKFSLELIRIRHGKFHISFYLPLVSAAIRKVFQSYQPESCLFSSFQQNNLLVGQARKNTVYDYTIR